MTTDCVESTTTACAFQISGAFVTEMARDFLREGNWRKGYHFLMDSMQGMEAQNALDILQGKKRLEGVNDLDFEDDTAEAQKEIKDALDYQMRHCFQFQGRFYEPYGKVSVFKREDWHFARRVHSGEDPCMVENRMWRAVFEQLGEKTTGFNPWSDYKNELALRPFYYASKPASDVMVVSSLPGLGQVTVLCKERHLDVPLWYEVTADAHAVIRALSEARELRELTQDDEDLYFVEDEPEGEDAVVEPRMVRPAQRPAAPVTPWPASAAPTMEDTRGDDEFSLQDHADILQKQIGAQADADDVYGWLELSAYDQKAGRNVSVRVPHRAFICAALGRARAFHLMPEYQPRCPSGMKMYNDDRFHTDAWVGAGLPLDDAYNDDLPEQRLFMDKLYELQRNLLQFSFDVLARGKEGLVFGEVTHDPEEASADKILVLKTADPAHADAAMRSKAVIVETGSKLAHLVIVSREEGVSVVRMEGALEKFPAGRKVTIDFEEGKVELWGV